MPKPKKGESKEDYLGRCMGYPDMQKYDKSQRYAICNKYWENKNESIDMASLTDILLYEEDKKISKTEVMSASKNAAEDIHGKVDNEKLKGIVNSAISKGKDTEDAIQIAINMMRSKK